MIAKEELLLGDEKSPGADSKNIPQPGQQAGVDQGRKTMILETHLDHWFTYHKPTDEQLTQYANIREAGLQFAQAILRNSPPSADQTAAIRKVREAVMTANAAIACQGR
jgi:hypothetical protein